MRGYIATCTVLLLVACYHGPSVYKFTPVQGPHGVDADLRLQHTTVQGELLEVQDSALIVLSDSDRVVSVPISAIRLGRFGNLGDMIGEGVNPRPALAQLRPFSRFPSGLTPELRARLLAAYNQTAYDIRP